MLTKIETERLILRSPRITDLEDFYNYAKKSNIGPSAGWLPHTSLEETKAILNDFIDKEEVWTITIKPNDVMVGTIGLHVRDFFSAINGIAEIGYVLNDEYWNNGYMTEAVRAIIDIAFNEYGFKKLVCGHEKNNIKSQRIILKTGFKFSHIDDTRVFANKDIKEIYMYELESNSKGGTKNE